MAVTLSQMPDIGAAKSTEEKLALLIDSYQKLRKDLEFALQNISVNNMDRTTAKDIGDISGLQSTVTSLNTKVLNAESNINELDGRLDTAEINIITLDGRLDSAESNLTSLDRRIDTAESNITDLDGRLDTAENSITILESYELSGTILPIANEIYRGKRFLLFGDTGIADKIYVCLKNATDIYEWI